jgi:hypothetical protein
MVLGRPSSGAAPDAPTQPAARTALWRCLTCGKDPLCQAIRGAQPGRAQHHYFRPVVITSPVVLTSLTPYPDTPNLH